MRLKPRVVKMKREGILPNAGMVYLAYLSHLTFLMKMLFSKIRITTTTYLTVLTLLLYSRAAQRHA